MNIMQMMKQAQDLQNKLKKVQEELQKMEVTGESAGVIVTCNGQGKFKSIKFKPEALDPDNPGEVDPEILEMLEDIVTSAMLKADMAAMKIVEEKMGAATGGLKIPGLF